MRRIARKCLVIHAILGGCHATPVSVRSQQAPDQVYQHGAVAADHPAASQAGLEMLKHGGNAVDAAVATSFCLSVVRPYSCGIGGGGFMLVYIPARDGNRAQSIAINYRETCPAAIGPSYYADLKSGTASRIGPTAVAVPGTVAGLTYALQKYGTLDLETVLQPAIRAAENGVPADANFVSAAHELADLLHEHPDWRQAAAPIWIDLCRRGKVMVGDIIKQPDQAHALRLIAKHGAVVFYRGEIARAMANLMHSRGGAITMTDLEQYRISETHPLSSDVVIGNQQYQLLLMPPPSSGGIAMQQIFGILQRRSNDLQHPELNTATYVHLVTEATKHAFADRAQWLADPEFVDVPTANLVDPNYLDKLAGRISMTTTLNPSQYGSHSDNAKSSPHDSGTSHFCVIDSSGMAVACTETINLNYGSLVSVPGFGFVLNDEMDDFTTVPGAPNAFGLTQSERNLPQPGMRPLSSMSPTIVLKDGQAALIAGASGGPRIITATAQCILNCLLFGMPPAKAVSAPRFHHQWMPDTLGLEPALRQDEFLVTSLQQRGQQIELIDVVGQVQMIQVTAKGILAASDPRKGGAPAGW